jgi:UDP-glucose 4-epimerase
MEDKNIVVTGGLGFIGSHLVERLVENNHVTILDDKSSGKLSNLIKHDHENLEIITGNITELNLQEIFQEKDYIFHQAAMASVPLSIDYPEACHHINATGTLKILIAARDCGVKKLVNASSSAVYGDTTQMPLKESEPLNPLSPYAASKASAELYCKSFYESYGLPTVSLRYFNVFGPKQDPNSQYAAVIPKFIDSIIKGDSPIIYGDGEQSRDFIYVKEVVEANIKACESSFTGVLNVAGGKAISINQLFYMITDILNSDLEPKYRDPRSGDIVHSLADARDLEKIGFKQIGAFKKQLKETVEWFKNQPVS